MALHGTQRTVLLGLGLFMTSDMLLQVVEHCNNHEHQNAFTCWGIRETTSDSPQDRGILGQSALSKLLEQILTVQIQLLDLICCPACAT